MSTSACNNLQIQEGWENNRNSAIVTIIFCAITIAYYIWDMICLICAFPPRSRVGGRFRRFMQRYKLDIGSLSGVMASAVGLTFLYVSVTPWPQPIEGAALELIVFAQISALIWQDRTPEGAFKLLAVRIPDLSAVGVAIATLVFTEKLYIDTTQNTFSVQHEPMVEVYISTAISSFGLLLGVAREYYFVKGLKREHAYADGKFLPKKVRSLIVIEILFVLQQLAMVVTALIFGFAMLAENCHPFKAEKWTAMGTLVSGLSYSLLVCWANLSQEIGISKEDEGMNLPNLNGEYMAPSEQPV